MTESFPPVFLATAVESVIRAGEIQMAHFGSDMRVDKKGAIDLVTEIDLRYTKLQCDADLVLIPNANLFTNPIRVFGVQANKDAKSGEGDSVIRAS